MGDVTQQSHKFKIHTNKILFGILLCVVCLVPNMVYGVTYDDCVSGKYMKAWHKDNKNCTPCKDVTDEELKEVGISEYDVYCPGLKSAPNDKPNVQGLKSCSADYDTDKALFTPKSDRKGCEQTGSVCDYGDYLPPDSIECIPCPTAENRTKNWYCPGGRFYKQKSEPNGLLECASDDEIAPEVLWHSKCVKCPSGKVPNKKGIWTCSAKAGNTTFYGAYSLCISSDITVTQDMEITDLDKVWGCSTEDINGSSDTGGFIIHVDTSGFSGHRYTIQSPEEKDDKLKDTYNVVQNAKCQPGQVAFDGSCVACTSNQDWIEYARNKRMYCPGVNTWWGNNVQK